MMGKYFKTQQKSKIQPVSLRNMMLEEIVEAEFLCVHFLLLKFFSLSIAVTAQHALCKVIVCHCSLNVFCPNVP